MIALFLEELYCPPLAPFMILMGTWPLLHSKLNKFYSRCCKDNLPCSRVSAPTVGKVAARNRTVGETGDTAMFQARQLWPSESSGDPLFFRRFNGTLRSMLLSKID